MIGRIAADAVMLLHFAFVAFVVFGGFLVMKYAWLAILHLPAVIWAAYIEISGDVCPLTYVENGLRRGAGETGPGSGFIEHYIHPLLYPPGLTRNVQWALALIVLGGNAILYVWLLRRRLPLARKDRGHS